MSLPGAPPLVASPRGRLDPNAWPSAPDLEPSEGEQDERYDERTDRVLASDVRGARLESREKRGKATHWNEPVHGGDGKEQDAKKSGDQRQGSVHRADVREDRKFSVTARLCAIKTQKQISYGVSHAQREQAPLPVLLAVVKHMATLAQGLQISRPVIGGIMVEVRSRQRHPGCANSDVVSRKTQSSSASIAPGPLVFVPPSTVAQVPDLTAMRPAAPLAPPLGSLKPDHRRKLRPVDRIKPFVLGADRHRAF
jgi:hypothetical protein